MLTGGSRPMNKSVCAPSSPRQADTMGADADVVIWDYRMVEGRGETAKGECTAFRVHGGVLWTAAVPSEW